MIYLLPGVLGNVMKPTEESMNKLENSMDYILNRRKHIIDRLNFFRKINDQSLFFLHWRENALTVVFTYLLSTIISVKRNNVHQDLITPVALKRMFNMGRHLFR